MMKSIFYLAVFAVLIAQGCRNTSETGDELLTDVKTPVTITTAQHSSLSEYIELSATSVYQKKDQLKANITGYIEKSSVRLGEYIEAGSPMYYIRTKEAEVLRKFHVNDTSNKITGLIVIKAPETGIITEVLKYTNDYVTDGDALATIAQQNSFVFILNVPFEQKKYAPVGTQCTIMLPDSTILRGTITSQLSMVDPVSQTQSYAVKVNTGLNLPENLVATVQLVKHTKPDTQVLEKSCVLTDETMENFWVMKLINDTTAVRVPVVKGISADNKIEIVSPVFGPADRIINTGQYGLADTAFVTINK
jgi:biotin carboxyl carrier protein